MTSGNTVAKGSRVCKMMNNEHRRYDVIKDSSEATMNEGS